MLNSQMEINKLKEEKLEKQVKELIEQNKQLIEELKACQDIIYNNLVTETDETEDKTTYEQWLDTEEGNNLADAYAEAMNMNTNVSEELI